VHPGDDALDAAIAHAVATFLAAHRVRPRHLTAGDDGSPAAAMEPGPLDEPRG
jgi:hypothetical protein